MPRYLDRPEASASQINASLGLPYGMTALGVLAAVNDIYAYLHALNAASIEHGYARLEDLMQPAGYSGLLSQLVVVSTAKQFANVNPGLAANQRAGGRPDLVPRAAYPDDAVLRGDEGVEVKVTRYRSSIQGHNPETGWIMVVQVEIDRSTEPVYDRAPTFVDRVMIGHLEEADWNYSGRREGSRRTPTASINAQGRAKLAAGTVYSRLEPLAEGALPGPGDIEGS